jgi:LPXTG-site transpeptidase (sortase) family protein
MSLRRIVRDAGRGRLVLAISGLLVAAGVAGALFRLNSGSAEPGQPLVPSSRFAAGYPVSDLAYPSPTPTPVPPTPTPEPRQAAAFPGGTSGGGSYYSSGSYDPGITTARSIAGYSLSIPKLGVHAALSSRVVTRSGVMPDPAGPWDVVWYDFPNHPGVGGFPGEGGNAVFAGHVDYVRIGKVVFGYIETLVPGDQIVVNTPTGPLVYAVQNVFRISPYEDATPYLRPTGVDAVTLITCGGVWSGHDYSYRVLVYATRI